MSMSDKAATMSLKVRDLRVEYATGLVAADNVDLEVRRGEIVGVIGESGSGKSTVGMSIMGLLSRDTSVTSQCLEIDGIETGDFTQAQYDHLRGTTVSMIFQEPMTALNPTQRVWRQIAEVLEVHGIAKGAEAKAKVLDLLRTVRLPDPETRMNSYPHQLSGGQRQRVLIAAAIAASPVLMVADEPTTALDVTVQAKILELIAELRDRVGMGVLFVSHDVGVIAELCDRVVVMRKGEIVERGVPAEVFSNPQHSYTRDLLKSLPSFDHPPRTPLAVMRDGIDTALRFGLSDSDAQAQPQDEVLLSVKNVSKQFRLAGRGLVQALDDCSFDVRKGETFGVVGESGSGKSTLARLILLMDQPTEGSISFAGEEISSPQRVRRGARSRMQIVFQDPNGSLDPKFTIEQTIAEPLRGMRLSKADRRERIGSMLESVGLERDTMQRRPHEFSGGQRQRIAIARAMITDPDFVVLDEPTSALDVSVQAVVLNLLLDLQVRTGVTYFFISHNLAVVRHLSHRMAVLKDGRIVEQGTADRIFAEPETEYTRELLRAVPDIKSLGRFPARRRSTFVQD